MKIKKRSSLHEEHIRLGASMTVFAGWEMPLRFTGVLKEHLAVRERAGLFDISHMGEIEIQGQDAMNLLNKCTTGSIHKLKPSKAMYTLMCDARGMAVDDLIVYCLNPNHYLLCVNAANTEKDLKWLSSHTDGDVQVTDLSHYYAVLALQGPLSRITLEGCIGESLNDLDFLHLKALSYHGEKIIVSRTGYTGERGYEIFISKESVITLWSDILRIKKADNILPAGMGARDSLRLEAAYPLYGHELNNTVNPLEAGLNWTIDFEKDAFIGKKALVQHKEEGGKRKVVGLIIDNGSIPRHGNPVYTNSGIRIGTVTSGGYSPCLSKSLALAMLSADIPKELFIETRPQKRVRAFLADIPFVPHRVRD